jgi:hypothetical protein
MILIFQGGGYEPELRYFRDWSMIHLNHAPLLNLKIYYNYEYKGVFREVTNKFL